MLVLFSISLNLRAQKPKFTFRSEIKGIKSADRAYPLPSTEGAITVRAERGAISFLGNWQVSGYFHQKPSNSYSDTTKIYENVGSLTIDSIDIPKETSNGYILTSPNEDVHKKLNSLFGKNIVWKFDGNREAGYDSFSYTMRLSQELNVRLKTIQDTSYKTGDRLSLKKGTVIKWDEDNMNHDGVLISFRGSKYWNGTSNILPGIEYGQNNVLTKDDGSYEITEKDLQNFPNDPNVMIMVNVIRFNKAEVKNTEKRIQLYFEENVFGIILFRKD